MIDSFQLQKFLHVYNSSFSCFRILITLLHRAEGVERAKPAEYSQKKA